MKSALMLNSKTAIVLPQTTWRTAVSRRANAIAKVSRGKVCAPVSKQAEAVTAKIPAPHSARANMLEGDSVIEKELAENGALPPSRAELVPPCRSAQVTRTAMGQVPTLQHWAPGCFRSLQSLKQQVPAAARQTRPCVDRGGLGLRSHAAAWRLDQQLPKRPNFLSLFRGS